MTERVSEAAAPRGAGRALLRSTAVVGAGAIAVRLAMAARDIALARGAGAGSRLDAFFVALSLPLLLQAVIGGGVHVAFIPGYLAVRRRDGDEAAGRLFRRALGGVLGASAVLTLALFFGAPLVVRVLAPGFGASQWDLASHDLLLFLPVVVLGSTTALLGAVLNAHERYALAASSPVLAPAFAVVVLVPQGLLGGRSLDGVAWAIVAGWAAETALLAAAVAREGLTLAPARPERDPAMRQFGRQLLPAAAGSLITASNLVVDQAVAAGRGTGTVSALNYGGKVVSFVVGVGAAALGTVVLPRFSALVAAHDWPGIRHTLAAGARLATLAGVPATAVVALASRPLVSGLFERGAFSAADARLAAGVQAAYAFQIAPALLSTVGVRLLSSVGRNALIARIAVVNAVVNLGTDVALAHWFGVRGIAWSTSIVFTGSCAMIWWCVRRELTLAEAGARNGPDDLG